MPAFVLKFYHRLNPLMTQGRYFDAWDFDAADRRAAVEHCVARRGEYPQGTAFVALIEGDDRNPFWSDELDHARMTPDKDELISKCDAS